MSGVRVLVGTRKGAFILTSDGRRDDWKVNGPHFGGWEMYHLKASPVDPNRLYASQSTAWFGQHDPAFGRRRRDVGAGRQRVPVRGCAGNPPVVRRDAAPLGVRARLAPRTVSHRRRHGLRGRRGRGVVPLGRRRRKVERAPRAARARLGARVAARRGRHVPAHDPDRSDRNRIACSSRSRPRACSAPTTAATRGSRSNRGLHSEGIPDGDAEVGHCVHRIAMHPSAPDVLYMQKHWDVMRSDDGGDSWHEVSGNLPSDFGFPIDVHAHEPETVYVVPITSDSEHYPPEGKLRVYRSRTGGNEWEAAHEGAAATRLLRQRASRLDGRRLARLVRHLLRHDRRAGLRLARLPATTGSRSCATSRPCLSVEVQTLP